MNWDLSPIEREVLSRDCQRSGVATHVSDPQANTAVVAILKKGAQR